MAPLTTGQVAKAVGVSIQTIRFYEREGILPAPRRTASGYRQYTEETVRVVAFVKRAQELGFTARRSW
jgi:MerR family copper efflux transcriptional regulator